MGTFPMRFPFSHALEFKGKQSLPFMVFWMARCCVGFIEIVVVLNALSIAMAESNTLLDGTITPRSFHLDVAIDKRHRQTTTMILGKRCRCKKDEDMPL